MRYEAMNKEKLEKKSEFNIRAMRNSATWMAILGVILLGALYLGWLIWSLNWDVRLIDNFYNHLLAVVGVPGAVITAFVIVSVLEQVSGPIEFEGLGFKFKGASGPVVLWVLVFLALVVGLKTLW